MKTETLPVPLTIIGGFLGSGKTSLLNHIINNTRGKRFAVLVNDFGEINIDAKLVVSVEDEGETISLANGCVCCVIRDDLLKEVIRLFERDPLPEHDQRGGQAGIGGRNLFKPFRAPSGRNPEYDHTAGR
jgi:Ni2+-binding GTPase involved in maturation of urease and hydrogenase